MKIPSDRKFTQLNNGDLFGVLNDSRNMILDVPGKAILSRKPVAVMSSDVDADFGYPMSIVYFSSNYVVVTSNEIFEGGLNGTAYSQLTGSPTTNLATDAILFNGYMYVTTASNLSRWDGASTWNNSLASLTSGVPHPMCIFDSQTTYKLAIGNGNTVKTYDTSHNANSVVLTLPSQFEVTTIRYRNGYLYIGTRNTNGGEARVFIWNGEGTNAQYECPIGAEWIFSMCEYGSSVAVITAQGQLLQIKGSTYKELAAFPVFYRPDIRWQGSGGLALNGKVFNRGMTAIGDNIYINVDGGTDTGFVPEMKSGLWVFNPVVGLNHRSTLTTDGFKKDSSLSVTDSVITTSVPHLLKTGDAVMFSSTNGLTGVDAAYTYYVTVTGASTIKLSMSREAVEAERYVTITGTPDALDVLIFAYGSDYGSLYAGTSGAIARTVYNETPLDMWTSEIIWGGRTDNTDRNSTYVLNTFTDSFNIGSLITQRIYSDNLEQSWKSIYSFIDGLKNDVEQVNVKIQTRYKEPSIILTGVWANADSIHLNSTDEFNAWGDIEEGDELIFTRGYAQGYTCHVTEINPSTSVVSLTVDESLGVAGKISEFYFMNFKKCNQSKTNEMKESSEFVRSEIENAKSAWVTAKLEFRGFRIGLNVVDLSNSVHKSTL